MRYYALATDFDGTIAHDGVVEHTTIQALERWRASGRHLVLVTGRILEDLMATFPRADLFEIVVAENGALLYFPDTRAEMLLCAPPSKKLSEAFTSRGVPFAAGRVIVATWDTYKEAVLECIQETGLEMQIIFNKGALMILPAGITKSSGLEAALSRMELSAHDVLGVGDAENDHAFLGMCECSAAVANAIPSIKECSDFVTEGDHGAGVTELIEQVLENELKNVSNGLARRNILVGHRREDGEELRIPVYGSTVLVAGESGGGKSALTTGVLERLVDSGYQFLAIDPEGDYEAFEGALVLGDPHHAPDLKEMMSVLGKPDQNLIINLLGISLEERPNFFETLLARVMELRMRTGRPHWLILDEAHHVLPSGWQRPAVFPPDFKGLMMITLNPDRLAPAVLKLADMVIAVGEHADQTIKTFAERAGITDPEIDPIDLEKGDALMWSKASPGEPVLFRVAPHRSERRRHRRKYAEAELTPDRSFFFRGPEGKLNLRAQNLTTFLQIMDGVDDETWLYHLGRGEYSKWFRDNIKNDELAEAAQGVEKSAGTPAAESRGRIREIIEERYTAPA